MTSCAGPPVPQGAEVISGDDLSMWIQKLASDEFEGRGPSSPGEEKTVVYLREQFEKMGLEPGHAEGFFQNVPLVDITVEGTPTLQIQASRRNKLELAFGEQTVLWTKRVVESSELAASEMVFVGYGVVAPEYDWNDYEGVDVTGKTVVILVNDPGYTTEDDSLFNGRTMTYYGRWTYKYEEAARQGAAGALIVHETGPAGYGWDTVRNSWTGPQFDLVSDDNNMSRVAVEGWLSLDSARSVFSLAGQDLDELSASARSGEFKAQSLGLKASVNLTNKITRSESRNVVAQVPGSDKADEYVIYMAHWDHFGRDSSLEGDQIYNGALDNATGTAGLLAIAKAYASLEQRPSRSILFLAVTAEEFGLHGSAYYGTHPIVPTNKTVGAINMDGLNMLGPMKDITVVGLGNSDLDDYLRQVATEAGRTLRPDPEPEKGFYYRSDHFSLAKVGVPSLYTDSGIDSVEHGEDWSRKQRDDYTKNRYHRTSDEWDPKWEMSGAVDDLRILYEVGHRIASSSDFPNWKEGTEFKAIRDKDLQ